MFNFFMRFNVYLLWVDIVLDVDSGSSRVASLVIVKEVVSSDVWGKTIFGKSGQVSFAYAYDVRFIWGVVQYGSETVYFRFESGYIKVPDREDVSCLC